MIIKADFKVNNTILLELQRLSETNISNIKQQINDYIYQGNYKSALIYCKDQLDIHSRKQDIKKYQIIQIQDLYASLLYIFGQYGKSLTLFLDSIQIAEKFINHNDPQHTFQLDNIGKCYLKMGHLDKAKEYFIKSQGLKLLQHEYFESNVYLTQYYIQKGDYDQAYEICETNLLKKTAQTDIFLICENMQNKGKILKERKQFEESKKVFKETIKLLKEKIKIQNNHIIADSIENIALMECENENYQEALKLFNQVISIREQIFSNYIKTHPQVADTYFQISLCLYKLENKQKALEFIEKCLKIVKAKEGYKNLLKISQSLNMSGILYMENEQYSESLKCFKEEYEIRKKLKQEGLQMAKVLTNIAQVYQYQLNLQKSLKYHFKSLSIKEKLTDQENIEIFESVSSIANILFAQENYKEAIVYFEKKIQLAEKLKLPTCIKVANTLYNIGYCYKSLQQLSQAIYYHKKSLELRKTLLKETDLDLINSLENISSIYYDMQKYEEALEAYKEELQLKLKVYDPKSLKIATIYNNMACTFKNLGRITEALKMHYDSLDIKQELLGPDHLDVSTSLDNIASIIYDQGNYKEALTLYTKVLEIRQHHYKNNSDIQIAITLHNLACSHYNLKNYQESLILQKQVLEIRRNLQGPDSKDLITSLDNIASNLYDNGQYEEAIQYYKEELELMERLESENKPRQATILNNIACTLHNMKKLKESLENHLKALEIRKKYLGEYHLETISSLNNIASNLFNIGKLDEALDYFQQILYIRQEKLPLDKMKIALAYENIGSTYYSMLKFENALEYFEKSYQFKIENGTIREISSTQEIINTTKGMILQMQLIQQIPSKQYIKNNDSHSSNSSQQNEFCNICLEELIDQCYIRVLDCGHLFHQLCIDKWLIQKKNCPYCRQQPNIFKQMES